MVLYNTQQDEKTKMTYPQNWSLYNLSQTREKLIFLRLLNNAVDYLNIPYDYKGNGRPHVPYDDMIKCCCIKVFNCFSSRRTIAELELAHALGYIRQVYHFNTISKYMNEPAIETYLHQLYKLFAASLVNAESVFAIDATGFSLPHRTRWKEIRLKGEWRELKDYKKLHIVTGVRTNVVTSAEVMGAYQHETTKFEALVRDTAKRFRVRELCADRGYLAKRNCDIVKELGGKAFIMPRSDTRIRAGGSYEWLRMIKLWNENRELFKKHYHQRSNVESTFSMMKRKFLGHVRSKTSMAQINEILCKVVCHNGSVLVNSIFELGVEVKF